VATAGTPVGPFPPGTDPEAYDRLRRRVLWMLPSGLYLLGGCAGGRRNLMTLNWATQLSFDPKLVGVSVESAALTHRLVDEGGVFALSLVARDDRSVVRKFVRPAEEGGDGTELNGFAVHTATTGAPIFSRAPGWLDCEVRQRVRCGGHTLFIGEVVDSGSSTEGGVEVLRMEDTRMNYGG
jgi:flavin reductase (DIM6/NTAB) family NADH-FMN oxidoreductase RutF